MQQPHTETSIEHTDGQQDTGNHKKPHAEDAGGADRFGGTRTGAENVEDSVNPANSGPGKNSTTSAEGKAEQAPERDERGRL